MSIKLRNDTTLLLISCSFTNTYTYTFDTAPFVEPRAYEPSVALSSRLSDPFALASLNTNSLISFGASAQR